MGRDKKQPHLLSKAFLADLRAVWKSESRAPPILSREFLCDLEDAYEADGRDDSSPEELEDLGERLDDLAAECEDRLRKALCRLPRDHPVNCPISLFGTMDFGRLEVAHTRTLAWLLDPTKEHGFENALVTLLLKQVQAPGQRTVFYPHRVQPERYYRNSAEEDAGRTDIWVEGSWRESGGRKPGLIVIEAKVDSSEGEDQLARYNAEIDRRRKEHSSENVCRIFLTPDEGREATTGKNWKALSFCQLARALCDAADSLKNKPGYHYFRFYVAGILRDILRLPIGKSPARGDPGGYRLLGFLEKKLKRINHQIL